MPRNSWYIRCCSLVHRKDLTSISVSHVDVVDGQKYTSICTRGIYRILYSDGLGVVVSDKSLRRCVLFPKSISKQDSKQVVAMGYMEEIITVYNKEVSPSPSIDPRGTYFGRLLGILLKLAKSDEN